MILRPNGGVAAARNTGLKVARGQYVVFLDGDDRLHPTALEQQTAQLQQHPEASFVTGRRRKGGGDDLDFYLRLAQSYRGVDRTGVVTDYRLHTGMKSMSYEDGLKAT